MGRSQKNAGREKKYTINSEADALFFILMENGTYATYKPAKGKRDKTFDTPGILSPEQRNVVFTDKGIAEMGKLLRKPMTKMGFVLQRGYFILQKKFFVPTSFHREDIEFVSKHFPGEVPLDLSGYAKTSYNRHRKIILERYGYVQFNEGRQDMENEARELVKTALRPREMFHALRDFLVERKIEHPKYKIPETRVNTLYLKRQ